MIEILHGYEAHDRLRDGRSVQVRAIRPDDKHALQSGLHRLSPDSAYFRFFRPKRDLSPQELAYFTEVDFHDHVALVAVLDGGPTLVGVGRYIVCDAKPTRSAEIALVVDETHQGLGIATLLLRHLVKIARAADISAFFATVLAENRRMLAVLDRSGLPQKRTEGGGVVVVRLSLAGEHSNSIGIRSFLVQDSLLPEFKLHRVL